jgi:leader peptidase (prepilin peptidase)/N-methyltransferase
MRNALRSLPTIPLIGVGLLATGLGASAAPVIYLAAVTPWLVTIDIGEHRLPNLLVLPGIGVGLVGLGGEWIARGRAPWVPLIAGVGYAAFLLVLHRLGGMGMGDVKLGAALGLASWDFSIAILSPVVAFVVGGMVGMVLLVAGRRGARIAFGPFLLGGFWTAVLLVALARL